MSPVSQSLAEEWGGEKGLLYNQSVCSGDDKAELKAEGVQYYQELIGGLHWASWIMLTFCMKLLQCRRTS